MDEKVIYDFKDQLRYLEKLNKLWLKQWIISLLFLDETEPLYIPLPDACNVIRGFYHSSKNDIFKKRIREIIVDLFNNYNRFDYSNKVIFHLLGIIGFSNFTESIKKVKSLIEDGNLKDYSYRNVNIHSLLERVLPGLEK